MPWAVVLQLCMTKKWNVIDHKECFWWYTGMVIMSRLYRWCAGGGAFGAAPSPSPFGGSNQHNGFMFGGSSAAPAFSANQSGSAILIVAHYTHPGRCCVVLLFSASYSRLRILPGQFSGGKLSFWVVSVCCRIQHSWNWGSSESLWRGAASLWKCTQLCIWAATRWTHLIIAKGLQLLHMCRLCLFLL